MTLVSHPNILQAAEDFYWAAQRAFKLNIQTNLGGNISVRIGRDRYLTKPTGIGLAECTIAKLVLVNDSGRPLEGYAEPTKEIEVHVALFKARPDVHAIVHYHAPHATAYANSNQTIPTNTLHARRMLKKIPLLPELPEGSPELSEAVVKTFEDRDVVALLMVNHGLITIGSCLKRSQYMAELLEETAKTEWLARNIARPAAL